MAQKAERYTHRTIREVDDLSEKIATTRAIVEMHAPTVLSLFELLSKHLEKSLSLRNINKIKLLDETQVFSAQDLFTLQQVLSVHKCDLQLTQNNSRWNLNLPRYFLKPPIVSTEVFNTVLNQDLFLQFQDQLSQLKTHLSLFRNHFLQTQDYSSKSGSEIIRVSAGLLVKLHQHFATTDEVNSVQHQVLVFALYDFLRENLVSPLQENDIESAIKLEKNLESAWVGSCCEVTVFLALEQIVNKLDATTQWTLEFGDSDEDRTDAIDILLTINSKRIHIQVKSRFNDTRMSDIEIFDSKQLLQSPTNLKRLNIDYEGVERLQLGLFQLDAQGIVIVVNKRFLNLETASPTVELVTMLEQALQKIGILPQVGQNIV